MKLHRLKISSEFRGLPAGFEITFNSATANNNHVLEPICFVGLNGSGKSNVLEVLSEIFFYLEKYHLAEEKDPDQFKTPFGFIIEYSIPWTIYMKSPVYWEKLPPYSNLYPDVSLKITKKHKELPIIHALIEDKWVPYNKDDNRKLRVLPERIIGYSSGMNELISNPYIKMNFHYYGELKDKADESSVSSLDMNRLFFMDYDSNMLITICNFLFDKKDFDKSDLESQSIEEFGAKNLEPIKSRLKVSDLHSFSISIRLRDKQASKRKYLELPSELNLAIDHLKKCATCYDEKKEGRNLEEVESLELYFWVNKATKKAFRHHFRTAYNLYRAFYFFNLKNLNLISSDLHGKIKNMKLGENLSALLPKHESGRKVFVIHDVAFKKKGVKQPVFYEKLSDGEHQLLHILGTVILMDTEGSLFILDEPETHFNPDWRSQFVSLLNSCLKGSKREQEVIVTSHSPFIVSDCKPSKVYSFKRNNRNKIIYDQPDFNTFGASVNLISMKVFGKKETISGLAQNQFDRIKKNYDKTKNKQQAMERIEGLGDSIEKTLLLNYIHRETK
ncbi:MAG: restriction system-associated AAA family ATPase [Promethearchaeota archaeon]|jgi:restriction system-associated AAA family ATPase